MVIVYWCGVKCGFCKIGFFLISCLIIIKEYEMVK